MSRLSLQEIIEDIPFDNLPVNWNAFDLGSFSRSKMLWDYQQTAVTNAIKTLWKYYDDFVDYSPRERPEANNQRKKKFAQWYRDNGQDDNLDIQLSKDYKHAALLGDYYQIGSDDTLSYEQFLNRACSWMATGSGKTLVIIKLIEILQQLIKRGEIPPNDILILTHRDDLIEHLSVHLTEFNASNSDLFIHLRELREYASVKRDNPSLFRDREATVFYYRSDNLSDEQKEKIIDFRNYDNNGNWYVLLDEAHKGDREDSKRQHIYSILSRNGFLFNFSATFTDPRDLATTSCNFNLSEFIRAGYGKHIVILEQEIRAFRDDEDYNNDEKQKIVLKSLILLTYAKKFAVQIRRAAPGIYHNPLLLTLVNSVNTEDADLKLFFRELERIGKGKVTEKLWQTAKHELWEELRKRPPYMFEDENAEIDEKSFNSLSPADVLKWIYNGSKPGDIEILIRPSNRQELAFKLKTSDIPFALIKIGDIAGWLKDELSGYEINQSFEDESYFQQLNADESDINVLMGSRSFYEGWDSNRPNVINFINIGTGTDAKKFILQSVGRGVRIEPLKNKRKRLLPLYNAKEVNTDLFEKIKDKKDPLETLFIFGTNRDALSKVIEHLNNESRKDGQQQLSLFINKAVEGKTLLIPTYRLANEPMAERREPAKFEIATDELDFLKRYVEFVGDDRVLLALHNAEPAKLNVLHESLAASDDRYKTNGRSFKNINLLVNRILDYFSVVPEDFDKLKELGDEIRHFKQITVSLKDISELEKKIETVRDFEDTSVIKAGLKAKFERGEITLDEYTVGIEKAAHMVSEDTVQYEAKRLRIKHLANHYYIPLILSGETDRISYIKHIIQERSEIEFLNKLENYLNKPGNKFKEFDWWLFSKLDESLDGVYIPYYSPKSNRIAYFKPDFIFWLQKGEEYFIIFVDPKGIAHTDYQYKIDGYKHVFEDKDHTVRNLGYGKLNTRVFVFLFTPDVSMVSTAYKRYWFDNIEKVLNFIAGY